MIQIINENQNQQRSQLMSDFDVEKCTYLLADLECKRYVQERFLENQKLLPEDACLRASELWQKLLFTVDPKQRIVSPSLL